MERIHTDRGQAFFQLKERLKRAQLARPNETITHESDLIDDDETDTTFNVSDGGQIALNEDVATPQNKQTRARFGRRRTHNEELIVAPCGMILARETFYAAEAVSTVAVCSQAFTFTPTQAHANPGND